MRGEDGGIRTLRYCCARQRWTQDIQNWNFVNWSLVDPEDEEFDKYLRDKNRLLKAIDNPFVQCVLDDESINW